MSAQNAENYARQAMSSNKDTDEKLKLIAHAIAELAQSVKDIERDVAYVRSYTR
jgi:phage-related tail protein